MWSTTYNRTTTTAAATTAAATTTTTTTTTTASSTTTNIYFTDPKKIGMYHRLQATQTKKFTVLLIDFISLVVFLNFSRVLVKVDYK